MATSWVADPTGTQAKPNKYGVEIDGGATDNLIGADGVNDAAEQNLLSGNSFSGVWISGQGTTGNVVAGNLIGTSVTGNTDLPNGSRWPYGYNSYFSYYDRFGGGVVIDGGASGNRIGSGGPGIADIGEGNVVSGNANVGIEISGSGTSDNVVQGNEVGTDLTRTVELGNRYDGIEVDTA